MLGDHLEEILAGQLTPRPQDDEQASYAPMIKKEDGLIDWRQSSRQVDRHIRAMTPWPGAVTTWQGKNLKVLAASPVAGKSSPPGAPGAVWATNGAAAVVTGQGSIQLMRVQLAGKRALPIEDFLRGRPDLIGGRLGS